MEYKLPDDYAGLGEFAEYGFMPTKNPELIKKKMVRGRRNGALLKKQGMGVKLISPKLMQSVAVSATAKKAFPFREEFNKDPAAPSESEVRAAKAAIEAEQLQRAEDLKAQGKLIESEAVLAGDPLASTTQQVELERAQLEADRATRDAKIAADNKRNQMIGYALAGTLTLGVLFIILKK